MQIVIEIDEETYKNVLHQVDDIDSISVDALELEEAIYNGTPLPKGHGDLIDISEITAFRELECNGHNAESLDEFTVIIGADGGGEE